ncbi:sulfate/molybdate ABC transporter ATP-binding protein [Alkalihalophilus pseudofirmus]|uniref:sulfate/molybdate ABC transporter ATP-binding protein n=1 Tax=Alkalihalophilus pseudofirmus TaxID=79885 RepID=UPI00259BD11A|nr:sulfate/molybdate ABC transporter ATP-binding protein [Alkalihalophilus pseudofirmus]WEG17897.1 sulfate/molybdate ABC transporter ATP-binding protein [Alkalihalophilus pseudofirmus]
MSIQIHNVSKSFGTFQALDTIDLTIQTGELVALLGPSGSGKTTLLRIIAGLEQSDKGEISFDGKEMTNVDPTSRQVGFVFQHYALFAHMNVEENISYGLRVRPRKLRPGKKEIHEKVSELLSLVKLEGLGKRYPSQLSGGQRQRVALARALAVQPRVLLLDEPFGALDAKVRKDLRRWLRRLHDEFHVTSVFVTHDQEEALDVSDRVVVMNNGKIEQVGTPNDVYEKPNSPFVFDFLGNVNRFTGRLKEGALEVGNSRILTPQYGGKNSSEATLYARPHQMEILKEKEEHAIQAKISHIHAVGPIVFIELEQEGLNEIIEVEMMRERFDQLNLKAADTVYVRPKQVKLFLPNDYAI